MDFVGTPVSGLPWFLLTLSCLLFEVSFSCEASIGLIIEIKYVFSKFLVASDLKYVWKRWKNNILGCSSLLDKHLHLHLFSPFLGKRKMENISVKTVSFTQFFACSWFWKALNLQNQKHRCRWPMSLLQNQEHSIWTEGTVRSLHVFGMSFGCLLDVFWVSFGLLDGYNTGG